MAEKRMVAKDEISLEAVRTLGILNGASDADVDAFVSVLKVYDYAADMTIVAHLETSQDVHFLLSGQARVSVLAGSGREVTFEMLHAGAMFGELAAIDRTPRSAAVVTKVQSLVGAMHADDFMALVTTHAFFTERALQHLVQLSRRLMKQVYGYSALAVKGRVCSELLQEYEKSAQTQFVIGDSDMASRVGTTRENVNRTYGWLKKMGIIDRTQSQITLLQPQELAELIEDSEFS